MTRLGEVYGKRDLAPDFTQPRDSRPRRENTAIVEVAVEEVVIAVAMTNLRSILQLRLRKRKDIRYVTT